MHHKDPDRDPKQIAAMCYTSWRSVHGGKKPKKSDESDIERLISDEVRKAMEKEGLLNLWESVEVSVGDDEHSKSLTALYDLVLLRSGSHSKTEGQGVGDVAPAPLNNASSKRKEGNKVTDDKLPGEDNQTGDNTGDDVKSNELDATKAITELGKKLDGFVNALAAVTARLDALEKPVEDPPAAGSEDEKGEEGVAGSEDDKGAGSEEPVDLDKKVADLVAKALEKITGGESTDKKTHAVTGEGSDATVKNPLTLDLKELHDMPMSAIMKGKF